VTGPGQAIVRAACAKVNLALAVGPPDSGGMHPIASWMAPIDLADDITLTRLPEGAESRCEIAWAADAPRPSPIDWPVESDLGVRAHRLLEEEVGRPLPVRLEVRKRIPVGGGLGGGSSDAAAVLMGVSELFELGVPEGRLAALSRRLGSDVAFFLDAEVGSGPPRPAIVTGLGDRIERVARVPAELTLLLPPFGCPTGPVYRAYDEGGPAPLREAEVRALAAEARRTGQVPWERLFNDLAEPAARAVPAFGELVGRLQLAAEKAGAGPVCVSGSGSTLFAPASAERTWRGEAVATRRVVLL